jgi:hypothetical protein
VGTVFKDPVLKHLAVGLAALWFLAALTLAAPAWAATTVYADLVAQNDTGASGSATLTATDEGDLRVRITAMGLMPGAHAQHLHGASEGGPFMCASKESDEDGDGWLTNEEATGEYGDIFLALTTRGDTSPRSGLALDRMPVAGPDGRLDYDRTIPAAELPEGLVEDLTRVHVVQHGVDANGNGEYDLDALGESTFARSLGVDGVPEEATNPASCGMVTGAGPGHAPHGGVETGSGGGGSTPGPWVGVGLGLIGLAVAVEVWRRNLAQSHMG